MLIDELVVEDELFRDYEPTAAVDAVKVDAPKWRDDVTEVTNRFAPADQAISFGPMPAAADRVASIRRSGFLRIGSSIYQSRRLLLATLFTFVCLALLPSAAGAQEHEVQAGETLWDIAGSYGVTVDALIENNELLDPDFLAPGDRLLIPDPPYAGPVITHEVADGEALGTIAELYDVSFADLLSLNAIDDVNLIRVGDQLLIPEIRVDRGDSTVIDVQHVVVEGESLGTISETYDVGVASIMRANSLVNPDLIQLGDVLTIPDVTPRNERELIAAMLERRAEEYGLDANYFKGLTWHESGWQDDAISYAGAVGIGQLMPYTADYIASDLLGREGLDRYNAEDNIEMSAAYLAYLLELSDGDLRNTTASYYQGFTSVKNNGMRQDTLRYIENVTANAERFAAGELPG